MDHIPASRFYVMPSIKYGVGGRIIPLPHLHGRFSVILPRGTVYRGNQHEGGGGVYVFWGHCHVAHEGRARQCAHNNVLHILQTMQPL